MTTKFFRSLPHITSFATRSSFITKLCSGNEEAWSEFHNRYVRMIYYIGKKRGLSDAECEDLMAEVMLIFWKKIDNFVYDRSKGKFRSYLCKIATFVSMKIFYQKRRNRTYPISDEYPQDVDSAVMQEWHDYLLKNAMDELRENVDTVTYQAFYMLFVQEYSIAQVSAVTRKTPNNLYGIRHRCLKKLKAIITEYRQFEESKLFDHSHNKRSPY